MDNSLVGTIVAAVVAITVAGINAWKDVTVSKGKERLRRNRKRSG